MKITFVTVSAPAIQELIWAGKEINENYPDSLSLKLYYASDDMEENKAQTMIQDIKSSDIVFIDLMGSSPSVINSVYIGLEEAKGNIIPYGNSAREYLRLGKFTAESMKSKSSAMKMCMDFMEKMRASMPNNLEKPMPDRMRDMKNYSQIMKYFKIVDKTNSINMLYLLLRDYGNSKNIPKPIEPKEKQDIGICDPYTMMYYENIEEYNKVYPFSVDKPLVAILFYGHTYPTDTSGCVSEIKNRLEEVVNVLPIAVSGPFTKNEEKYREIILNSTSIKIDLILNFMSFRLGAGPMGGDANGGVEFLKEVGVPYIHPYFMSRRTVDEWEGSVQGCSTSEVLITVMLPELDGAIETYPIGAMADPKYNEEFDVMTNELQLIDDRVDKLVARVKNHINLRKKQNKDKKIAIICYNYPPGESNLFGGAFLDTFTSVENILKGLKDEEYNVNDLSKEELMNIFTAGKAVNSGRYGDGWKDMIKYPDKDYKNQFEKTSHYEEIKAEWGLSPGNIMSDENNFLIPGTIEGNVFIGLQPSRGIHEEIDKTYHDKTLPPHHQYMAFYKWIKDEFKADAVIHVGTHGTLEFLKGKECGMSKDCYPDKLIADIPHMYLYYCGNPSEATIAKRRSHANIISYQPPVFVPGELYGDYSKIMTTIDDYYQSLGISPQSSKDILQNILNMGKEFNLGDSLEDIENELYRMKISLIPRGLHAFGQGYNHEEGREYAKGLLRYNINENISLRVLIAEAKNYDFESLLDNGEYEIIEKIDNEAEELFNYYMDNNKLKDKEYINKTNKDKFISTLEQGKSVCNSSQENGEIEGLIRVLDGKYNAAKLAGDIYRHPEILPTGYNLYQFDPRLVPTKTAYERGNKICENTLNAYKKENNEYPSSIAVILWGIETSRTQGESFSQILSYLGVKVSSSGSQWEPKYEIISIEELGRPRIDVTINICGFFRDMFPNLIENLDDLFVELYELDETDGENYFKANSKRIYKKLVDEGYDEKEAKQLAISRMFGPGEGQYGTGITGIIETKNWETEEHLGNVFLDNLQYVYNRTMHGKKVEGLYKENLKSIEIVSQIRSSHEYEITDLDHYYEYFGGLSKSVEMVKGRKVKMYITDTTGDRIISESIEKSIGRGIRTRVLNPKWIDGMLEHKYHGVQKISQRFENVMGLAATTNSVEEWIYNDMHKSYVEDEKLREKLIENNPYAYMDILEQMMEYSNRGYWEATDEQIDKIKEVYLELEDSIEDNI